MRIPYGSCQDILTNVLSMSHVAADRVPRFLIEDKGKKTELQSLVEAGRKFRK